MGSWEMRQEGQQKRQVQVGRNRKLEQVPAGGHEGKLLEDEGMWGIFA